jgi:hypothetical protein
MTYTLSVVLLIPAAHKDAINALADQLGWGPDNLAIPLSDATWFGCHTWATSGFMDHFASAPPEAAATIEALIVSTREGGSPAEHWAQALIENGLVVDAADEQL